jgi:hypothetical protein
MSMNSRRKHRSGIGVTFALALALSAGGCAPLGLQRPADADAPEVLTVHLTDTSITVFPRLVGAGKVRLEMTNDGLLEHAVHVVGPGTDSTGDEFLVSGGRRTLSLKIGPGTFRVFCPDGDHAARGMQTTFEVSDDVGAFRR